MIIVKVRELILGDGIPKVCVPITGKTRREIEEEAVSVKNMEPDLVEWRADCYEEGQDSEKCMEVLKVLKGIFDKIPLLFTFRTAGEGGEQAIDFEDYVNLLLKTAKGGGADMIDVEVFFHQEGSRELVEALQGFGIKVIASNHHFDKTPSVEEMVQIMEQMEDCGADIVKLAVMPKEEEDLCALMAASFRMKKKDKTPYITMSMGRAGVLSRLCGEITGSAVTFASGIQASAPGQVPVKRLRDTMEILHKSFT